jgi:hypothetical protein
MILLDPNNSLLTGLAVPAGLVVICVLIWLLNKLLRKLGIREHSVDRVGSSLLELERLVRPRAEHVITARKQRRAEQGNEDDDPPESDQSREPAGTDKLR